MKVQHTPAKNLATDLPHASPDAYLYVDLGFLGKRRIRGYSFAEGFGPVKVRVETWRQMRDRERAEREAAQSE